MVCRRMIDPKLEEKVVLLTGANHGIGAAAARAFAAQGAHIFITYYRTTPDYSQAELTRAQALGRAGPTFYQA